MYWRQPEADTLIQIELISCFTSTIFLSSSDTSLAGIASKPAAPEVKFRTHLILVHIAAELGEQIGSAVLLLFLWR
jgi:hypothetical protein